MPPDVSGGFLFNVLAELGDDAIKQVNQHGTDLLPFLNNYTDEGLRLINSSDEAAEFVLKHWDDAPEKVALAVDYGNSAMQLMDSVDVKVAKKLLDNLDEKYIDDVLGLNAKQLQTLAYWKPENLTQFGPDLIKRVDKDIKIFDATKELIKMDINDIDSDRAKNLINTIAENSVQGDSGHFVLGNWAGKDGGYVGVGWADNVKYYESPDGFSTLIEEAFEDDAPKVFWEINQKVIKDKIADGIPFDYTLNGLNDTRSIIEIELIEEIWNKSSDSDLLQIMHQIEPDRKNLPARVKELQLLYAAGYEYSFDEISESFVFILKE